MIDVDVELEPGGLLIRGDVLDLGELLERLHHTRGVLTQLVQVSGLERVLILRSRRSTSHAHVLNGVQVEDDAIDARELLPQVRDDLIGARLALALRLEPDEHAPRVDGSTARTLPANECDEAIDVGL